MTVKLLEDTPAVLSLGGTDSHPAPVSSSHAERTEREDPLCSDIPEWLQEFKADLVDDRVPERRDSHASSSHEPSLEPTPTRSADWGKHIVFFHFPRDRNCEICQRTKITRAPCRRRIGGAVPRAVNFGDLITADHKVLSESCESRHNHRYAVVVQALETQWIQSYPCKTKTSQETQRSLQKFLETDRNPKVIYTDSSLEFGTACEDLSWNHCTSTPHRSETNGIAERAVRRVKEGTSAVLLQSGLDERWADSMECRRSISETYKISCLVERHFTNGDSSNHSKDQLLRLVRCCHDCISSARKSYQEYSSVMYDTRGESGKETLWSKILGNWNDGRI